MEDLSFILDEIVAGNYRTTRHAHLRMSERNISEADIVECALSGQIKSIDRKFIINGFDIDGEKLRIICTYKYDVLLITVI